MGRIFLIRILIYTNKRNQEWMIKDANDIQRKVVLLRPTDTGRNLSSMRKESTTPWQLCTVIVPLIVSQRDLDYLHR